MAEAERGGVGDEDDGAGDDEGDGWADVEAVGPERQEEVGREVGVVVDAEHVGRDGEDGRAHEQGERVGAGQGGVEGADGAHLGLEVEVLRVGVEGGRRRRPLGTGALVHFFCISNGVFLVLFSSFFCPS